MNARLSAPRELIHDEKSTVTVGFLILTVALYLLIAAIWNTGAVIDNKIQAQAIADSAALTGASHLASTVNDMVVGNMLELRLRSAHISRGVCETVYFTGIASIGIALGVHIAKLAAAIFPPRIATIIYESAQIGLCAADLVRIIMFGANSWQATSHVLNSIKPSTKVAEHNGKLPEYLHKSLFKALKKIHAHANSDANHSYDLFVTHPGCSYFKSCQNYQQQDYTPPPSNYLLKRYDSKGGKTVLLGIRFFLFDSHWKASSSPSPGDPPNSYFLNIKDNIQKLLSMDFFNGFHSSITSASITKTANILKIAWGTSVAGFFLVGSLAKQWDAYQPNEDANGGHPLRVIAVAGHRYPSSQNNYMAEGFFSKIIPGKIVAIAEAEAYNPYMEIFKETPGIAGKFCELLFEIFHSDYWSSLGANYQARLIRVDNDDLRRALSLNGRSDQSNGELNQYLQDSMNNPQAIGSNKGMGYVFLH